MSARRRPNPQAIANQRRASDPAHSAWVSAHAGSGKTHVLASRVIRLLLDGVPPARILCLTFTKAAAANMASRVFDTLSQWAVASNADLKRRMADVGAPAEGNLATARKLFARAVETPGGLKIQTIHAFCERVLHLFPFEANVAADFRVLEDVEEAELLFEARRTALRRLADDEEGRARLAALAEGTWDGGFTGLVSDMLAKRDVLRAGSAAARRAALGRALGLTPGDTPDSIRRDILDGGIPHGEWPALAQRLEAGSKNDQTAARRLMAASALAPAEAAVEAYFRVFLTDKNEPRGSLVTKGLAKADPDLAGRLEAERDRVWGLHGRWLGCRIMARTEALDAVCGAVLADYEAAKGARGLLDFNDLIGRTDDLLTHSHVSDWVLYKLDGGIDHILVDEAQDTSEAQWRILQALAREFTAGQGRPRRPRTFFAVGDEKQSIFSFQGAAPAHFDRMRRLFEARARDAQQGFAAVPLHMSFRSSPEILRGVDDVFADSERRRGLSVDDAALRHEAVRSALPGLIEIWPLVVATEAPPPGEWILPVDAKGDTSPPIVLARKIARKIKVLTDPSHGEQVEGAEPGVYRAVGPGDVMILVRRRDAFFDAIIRALKEEHVPVAGADRLDVAGHIAVKDCMAAIRAALLPDDDLTLATVLKSPLIGLDDDDLIALAPTRCGSLWGALLRAEEPRRKGAAERLRAWREEGARLGPFDFLMHLLGAEGGRRALVARLGLEAHDALDELLGLALAHERTAAPSLLTFLAFMDTLSLDVRRDMEAAGDAVRVMTVHAAKGLEAKIVFLPDTCGLPTGQHDPDVYALGEGENRVLAWSAGKPNDPPALREARERHRREQDDEYRRLLYVAMTRAEERLYIAGHANLKPPKDECWHKLVLAALEPTCRVEPDPLEEGATVWRRGGTPPLAVTRPSGQDQLALVPPWLGKPARFERPAPPPLRPSSALEGADRSDERDRAVPLARARGVAVHALLRRLPDMPEAGRRAAALRFLDATVPALAAEHGSIADAALAVMADPRLADLFGPRSLAEVAVAGDVPRQGRAPLRIAGQIDRLAEVEGGIFVADFKTGAPGPDGPSEAHLAQMAFYATVLGQIYPGRAVRAALVYVEGPAIVALEPDALAAALDRALGDGQAGRGLNAAE